ncbi:MAG: BadF/BadG/BcrA/BcrD ATPase family protein [Candidatus Aenigmatarchaeota archaeon]
MYFLGVDGGATKTRIAIADENEKLFLEAVGKGSNYRVLGLDEMEKNLYSLISLNRKRISYACFGLASIDSDKDKEIVYSKIKNGKIGKLLKCPIMVVNDVEIILPAIKAENGVAVIGGTGSNFFAKNGNKRAFAGGLDYILADEGSAFDIGQKILKAAVRSADGRGEKTILEKMVLKKAGIKNIRQLKDIIHAKNMKSIVAGFAPLAEAAMKMGDKTAEGILKSAIKEYAAGINAVANRVGLKGKYKIAIVGSVFNSKFLLDALKRKIKKEITIVKNPVLGAVRLAIKAYGE